jgi:hypothetical protein
MQAFFHLCSCQTQPAAPADLAHPHPPPRRDRYMRAREQAPPAPPLAPGDVEGIMRRIA